MAAAYLLGQTVIWGPAVAVFGCMAYSFGSAGISALETHARRTEEQRAESTDSKTAGHKPTRSSAFKASRLTQSTFLIEEYDDAYYEHPYIYAKLIPAANTVLLLDTGCGGASKKADVEVTKLREFIETVGVPDNGGKSLNEAGKMEYVVVLSHCHYDHILGVEQFAKDSTVIASAYSPSFISPSNLPNHSLCTDLGIHTPSYTPTLVPHLHPITLKNGVSSGVTVLHTPGHTPDELALWDDAEQMLYVGDTLYEHAPIIFPSEGSITEWLHTVDMLRDFVAARARTKADTVRINCGHATAAKPALEVLVAAKGFILDVLAGKEPERGRTTSRGEVRVEYKQRGGRFALICPERLVLEARKANVRTKL